jgi:demethylmenaquinone methyltransferase/2-methoxy-6-polyprenyl-1,4-benzoquinol methylase
VPSPAPDDLLDEQIAYYRARAPEYDDWYYRRGRYHRSPDSRRVWASGVAELEAAVDAFAPAGHVLELAAGTGLWTQRLVRTATSVTAVDASPEVLEINRERAAGAGAPVAYVVADLFSWEPPRRYDAVFFGFWLSHVPLDRFDRFWGLVDRALAVDGRVFLIDDGPRPDPGDSGGVRRRQLADGRTFDIVKVFWGPEGLRDRLAQLGWSADVRMAAGLFLHGEVVRG